MKSPIKQRVHFIKEVVLPSLTSDDVTFGWGGGGGEVSEGSGIYLCFCYYFEQAHFVMFSVLLVFLFVKLLYYTTYFFKNCTLFFFWCFA